MSIATYLNTGLAILGWAYIMVKTGQWITKNALRRGTSVVRNLAARRL